MTDKLEVLQGTLDLIVLKLLQGGAANGWQLTQGIQGCDYRRRKKIPSKTKNPVASRIM